MGERARVSFSCFPVRGVSPKRLDNGKIEAGGVAIIGGVMAFVAGRVGHAAALLSVG